MSKAVRSILDQTYYNIELIIADNESSDDTASLIEAFAVYDPRIRYFRHEKNIGAIANFDFVLQQATGEYFMWAAYDDTWDSLWVETLLKGFGEKGVVLSFGKVIAMDERGQAVRDCEIFSFSASRLRRLVKYFWMEDYSGKACLVYGLFRTSFLRKRKPLTAFLGRKCPDMLFVFNCLNYGLVHVDPSVIFYKRMPPDQLGRTINLSKILNSVFMKDRINYYIGHMSEAEHVFDRAFLLLLLPLKYIKAVCANIFRRFWD